MPVPSRRLRPTVRSRLRRLVQPMIAPSVFDFWAARIDPSWSWDRPRARIVAREAASADSMTLWLKPNRHCGEVLPGQHVNISAEIDGRRITRSYSPSVALRTDGCIAITIKRVDGGRLSRHLCDDARVGDALDLGPAFGEMVLPVAVSESWLFLAGGSGITPLMAMTRALAAQRMPVVLTLLYWCRTRAEFCFVDELRSLAAAHPNFRVHFLLTGEAAAADDERQGRIDAPLLASLVDDAATRHVYACGPGGFVEAARGLLETRCASFRAEAFTLLPQVFAEDGNVQVTLARSGRTLPLARGQSLLTALEAAGLKPASGCRMGICNTCACGKRSGSTRHLPSGTQFDEPASALKLCINSAVSDLVLEL